MKRLFYTQACLIAFIGFVHLLALQLYLYWHFPWLDLLVHFLAAAWVALFVVWLCAVTARSVVFWKILSIVVVIGIGWEFFEFLSGIPREANFVFDTTLDLLMDVLGGVSGFLFASRLVAPAHERTLAP